MKFINALVVKLVETKDLKAGIINIKLYSDDCLFHLPQFGDDMNHNKSFKIENFLHTSSSEVQWKL